MSARRIGYVFQPLPYRRAWTLQQEMAEQRGRDEIDDILILTEHPPTITIGKSGTPDHILSSPEDLAAAGIDSVPVDRGGDVTYHGPGQLVGYPILDLGQHYRDVHRYLRDLEEVLIRTLRHLGISAGRVPGLTGVWTSSGKIAAIGVKVAKWITTHGFALNLRPNLDHYSAIIPCGISDRPVTSLHEITGRHVEAADLVDTMVADFCEVFGAKPYPLDLRIFEEAAKYREVA